MKQRKAIYIHACMCADVCIRVHQIVNCCFASKFTFISIRRLRSVVFRTSLLRDGKFPCGCDGEGCSVDDTEGGVGKVVTVSSCSSPTVGHCTNVDGPPCCHQNCAQFSM